MPKSDQLQGQFGPTLCSRGHLVPLYMLKQGLCLFGTPQKALLPRIPMFLIREGLS